MAIPDRYIKIEKAEAGYLISVSLLDVWVFGKTLKEASTELYEICDAQADHYRETPNHKLSSRAMDLKWKFNVYDKQWRVNDRIRNREEW